MNISMAEQAKSDKHQVRLDMMLSFGNVFLFSLVCLVFFYLTGGTASASLSATLTPSYTPTVTGTCTRTLTETSSMQHPKKKQAVAQHSQFFFKQKAKICVFFQPRNIVLLVWILQ